MGLDVYDVVQPTTPQMDIAVLQKRFGDRLTFCGSLLRADDPGLGPKDVEERCGVGSTCFSKEGLFLSPTHAIQVGSPLENILTLYRACRKSAKEGIDMSILEIEDDHKSEALNLEVVLTAKPHRGNDRMSLLAQVTDGTVNPA